jgi:hypothetical protein
MGRGAKSKRECSFLKKRTKKLLLDGASPYAERGAI